MNTAVSVSQETSILNVAAFQVVSPPAQGSTISAAATVMTSVISSGVSVLSYLSHPAGVSIDFPLR